MEVSQKRFGKLALRSPGEEGAMKKPTIISIVNHKGGCLKTSVTVNLGAALARVGKRVLVVDLDAQQNLTASLIGPVQWEEGMHTLYEALLEEGPLDELIQETSTPGLDIVPITEDFAGADLSLVSVVGRESVLKGCFSKTERISDYDFVLLDNPPSISLVVMNSLVASDFFLVPCSSEYLPMVGLSLLSNSITRMSKLIPNLQPLGVILTLYSYNERICRQVESTLRKELGEMLYDTKIRVNTKAKSAPSVQKTIFDYEASPKGRGTEDFTKLAAEFLARVEPKTQETRRAVNG
jgi:chromosome partitioning protein